MVDTSETVANVSGPNLSVATVNNSITYFAMKENEAFTWYTAINRNHEVKLFFNKDRTRSRARWLSINIKI